MSTGESGLLDLDHVSKRFKTGAFAAGEVVAVDDVSFSIRPREITALVGESGSGKSTIGRMILRLTSTSAGSIRFHGDNIASLRRSHLKAYYRRVQGVFQDPFSSYNPIFKADRVFTIIHKEYFSDVASGEWQERVESSLRSVALNPRDVLNKFPHQLSGGQLQRLLVARALLLDIELLIADEIISMLDASTRIDVLNLLGDLRRRGLSVLFVTHDLSLANYIADRTIILRRGRIVEMGETAKVFGNPQHPYTQALLRAVPRLDERWVTPASGPRAGDRSSPAPAPAPAQSPPSRRYSRSALHPRRWPSPPSPAPGERVLEHRLPLLEVEAEHFVASEQPVEDLRP